jgi:UDP-2-acetamido-2,6-beta-L-arabino-hexul-4-ose reductase
MKRVLITGAAGFVGRNLMLALSRRDDVAAVGYDVGDSEAALETALAEADVVVHLAGVNRPTDVAEFETGNTELTAHICDILSRLGATPRIVMSSSIQAAEDNPYGKSKRRAEVELERFAAETGADVVVFRFKNLFGKWSRPYYNSVVATFCHNTAHGLPLSISDPARELDLVYIDDVVARIIEEIDRPAGTTGFRFADEMPSFTVTLGGLAKKLQRFRDVRTGGALPDFRDAFAKDLYSTYLSYLDPDDLAYGLEANSDDRGSLAEFIKSPRLGQIFVSRTNPGYIRGGHYHDTKIEKFLVVEGHGIVRMRHAITGEQVELEARGEDFRVIDIPPGFAHSIENVGDGTMVTLFWANEPFDPERTDTYSAEV